MSFSTYDSDAIFQLDNKESLILKMIQVLLKKTPVIKNPNKIIHRKKLHIAFYFAIYSPVHLYQYMASGYLASTAYMADDSLNKFRSFFARLINGKLYGGSFCQQKRLNGRSNSALGVKLSIFIHQTGLVYALASN